MLLPKINLKNKREILQAERGGVQNAFPLYQRP